MSLESLNAWSGRWAAFMGSSLVDAAVLLAVVILVWLPLRRRASAQLGYCLFLLVLVKLVVPIPVTVRGPLAWMSPRYALGRMAATMPTITPGAGASGASGVSAPDRVTPDVQPGPQAPQGQGGQPVHLPGSSVSRARGAETQSPQGAVEEGAGPIARIPSRGSGGRDAGTAEAWLAAPLWSSLSVSTVFMLGWAAVVLVLMIRFGWTQWRTWVWCSRAEPLDPALLPMDLKELRRQARVRRSVRMLGTVGVPSPAVWGLLRPCLLVPPDLLRGLRPRQATWLLLHELAHVSRGDLWVAALQRLVQIIHFFNPAVWLANWMIDRQREYACDDAALAACECSRRDCGEAFLSVVERANPLAACGAPALWLLSYRVFIRRRLLRILDPRRRIGPRRLSLGATVLFLAVAALVLPRVDAQDGAPAGRQDTGRVLAGAEGSDTSRQSDAKKTAAAVAALQGLGADVVFDDRGRVTSVGAFSARIRAKLSDEAMKHLEGLPSLKQLGLRHMPVSNAGLAHVQGLASLEQLDLGYTQLTDDGLVPVKALTGLRSLELAHTQIGDDGLTHLRGLTNLEVLDLSQTRITDAGLTHLRRLAKLNTLSLLATTIGDAGLRDLGELTNLTSLNLGGTLVGDAGLTHLKRLTNLRTLGLWRTQVTDAGLEHLRGLSNLETLWLGGTRITDAGLARLQGLTRLRTLNLAQDHISDAGLVALKSLRNIEVLLLGATEVSDVGVEHLATLTQLHELVLGHTRVTDAGLASLEDLRNLRVLGLRATQVTDAGLRHLKGLTNLQRLDLAETQVTKAGVNDLQRSLPKTHVIWGYFPGTGG